MSVLTEVGSQVPSAHLLYHLYVKKIKRRILRVAKY